MDFFKAWADDVEQILTAPKGAKADETVQCGADLLKRYQTHWRQIRKRGLTTSANAKTAEEGFCQFVDHWYKLHSEWLQLHKTLAALPQMRQDVEEIRQNIGQVCKKVDRIELVLDKVLERREQRLRESWELAHIQDIEELKKVQDKERHEAEQQILAELHKKNSAQERAKKDRGALDETKIQKDIEKDMEEYKKKNFGDMEEYKKKNFGALTSAIGSKAAAAVKMLKDSTKDDEDQFNEFMAGEDEEFGTGGYIDGEIVEGEDDEEEDYGDDGGEQETELP
jgi:NADH dehydrogenase/NADH:ubiquinone oxidoreductase subunit G